MSEEMKREGTQQERGVPQLSGHQPNKPSCTGGAGGGEARAESAQRIRCLKADNTVAEHAEALDAGGVRASEVQPGGHPISHSTNSGFKVRRMCEDSSPTVEIGWSGRIERNAAAVSSRRQFVGSDARSELPFPPLLPTLGVGHICTAPASVVPPVWFGVGFCAVCA